jgi:hypothetical protein
MIVVNIGYDYFNVVIIVNSGRGSSNIDCNDIVISIYFFLESNFYNGFLNLIGKVYFW